MTVKSIPSTPTSWVSEWTSDHETRQISGTNRTIMLYTNCTTTTTTEYKKSKVMHFFAIFIKVVVLVGRLGCCINGGKPDTSLPLVMREVNNKFYGWWHKIQDFFILFIPSFSCVRHCTQPPLHSKFEIGRPTMRSKWQTWFYNSST